MLDPTKAHNGSGGGDNTQHTQHTPQSTLITRNMHFTTGRKVRFDGNDDTMLDLAKKNAMALGAGHTFVIFMDGERV